jgi:hypothetical protein
VTIEIRNDGYGPCIGGGSSRDCERGECNARARCVARGLAVGDGGPRSHLGDLIVMHGPYTVGQRMTPILAAMVDLTEINALRNELIALRSIATGGPA